MGSKSKPATTTATTTNNLQYYTPPPTADTEALRETKLDPALLNASIASSFGNARRNLNEGLNASGYENPIQKERMRQIGMNELADSESSKYIEGNTARDQSTLQQKQFLATLTAPQLANTGGTTTQTQTPASGGLLGSIIGGGLSIAAAF